jgi:hypothetical protein
MDKISTSFCFICLLHFANDRGQIRILIVCYLMNPEVRPTPLNESREFTSVISNLPTMYEPDNMDKISTSFCFICLLHFANDRGRIRIQILCCIVNPEVRPTPLNESREFTSITSNLQTTYEHENMDKISPSFCFIYLSHLANQDKYGYRYYAA